MKTKDCCGSLFLWMHGFYGMRCAVVPPAVDTTPFQSGVSGRRLQAMDTIYWCRKP
ncbi:hypothetical protein [Salibacterium lacus]|uniref:Uncharacterized protein n=1 Tax=Salibacterium lacus TaxID=1898109 RepID=A0ABW5T3X0_9BACI